MRTEKDIKLLNEIVDSRGHIISSRTNERYLKLHGYYDYVMNRYQDNSIPGCLAESIHRLVNAIEAVPKCKSCGNKLLFDMSNKKYPQWCSPKCRNNDPDVKKKNAEGVSKYRKWEYANKKEEVQAKKSVTLKEHYGEDNNGSPFSCKSVQDKARETCIEKYGKNSYALSEDNRKKIKETIEKNNIKMWKNRGFEVSYTDHKTVIIHNGCSIHGDIELPILTFNSRMKPERRRVSPICPLCNPYHYYSGKEIQIKDFLDKNKIECETRTRKIITPQELDFYIKDQKIAIEVNGIYFHSAEKKDDNYHLNKTDLCSEKGIQLVHVWETFLDFRKDVVLSKLNGILGIEQIVPELNIVKIPNDVASKFIYKNTIYPIVDVGQNAICLKDGMKFAYVLTYNINEGNIYIMNRACAPGYNEHICFRKSIDFLKNLGEKSIFVDVCRDMEDFCFYESVGFFHGDVVPRRHLYLCETYISGKELDSIKLELNDISEDNGFISRYIECYDSGTATFKLSL